MVFRKHTRDDAYQNRQATFGSDDGMPKDIKDLPLILTEEDLQSWIKTKKNSWNKSLKKKIIGGHQK
jgi:hypothetical protein